MKHFYAAASLFLLNLSASASTKRAKKSKKSPKSSKAAAINRSLTGLYFGYDTEDATTQILTLVCDDDNNGVCNVSLRDTIFSTCAALNPEAKFVSGVALARDVPKDLLDNFKFDLYCLDEGQTEIDYTKPRTTTLTGNIKVSSDGRITRTGPGFTYTPISSEIIKDIQGDKLDINDSVYNINGSYEGTDIRDGSGVQTQILCTLNTCDVIYQDYFNCPLTDDRTPNQGVGFAKGVNRALIGDGFVIERFCVKEGEFIINPSDEPDETFTMKLELVEDGIVRATSKDNGMDITQLKRWAAEDSQLFSIYEDITLGSNGFDTEDGSFQLVIVECEDGLCDITLQDSSFSTCVEALSSVFFLGGIAKATSVPQESLHDFELPLFCAKNLVEGIDYGESTAVLTGNFVFLDNGIIHRTGPGFNYYNSFAPSDILSGLYFNGEVPNTGDGLFAKLSCDDETCEVILYTFVTLACTSVSGRPTQNAVAVNESVPITDLQDFKIRLYCASADPSVVIDYEEDPLVEIQASIKKDSTRVGVLQVRLTEDSGIPGVNYDFNATLQKTSTEH